MGLIRETYDELAQLLTAAGLPVITDSRNVRPPAVVIDPPSVTGISGTLVSLAFPVAVVAPPPGNRDALNVLLDYVADVVETVPTTAGEPGTYNVGGQDLPSYQLTVTLTARKDP